jgi:inorganic pyrophosphatase
MYLQKYPYNIKINSPKYPHIIPAFIEVAEKSRMKYEWDHTRNSLVLDRVLHSAVFYPHNYGFIPETLCDDGDPLDVLVMCQEPLIPGCIVDVRPICYMVMEDEKGRDEKLLAVVNKDPLYSHINDMNDIPKHVLKEISQFFETYKLLEKEKWSKVGSWHDKKDSFELIEQSRQHYQKIKKNSSDNLIIIDDV